MTMRTVRLAAYWRKPGVDAIEEFSVLTSNYEADYGKTSGVWLTRSAVRDKSDSWQRL